MIKNDHIPLARRMRPETLDEFVGQSHILGKGKLLREAILNDRISSLVLYGPPGCGKTTLAHIIAQTSGARFCRLNAVTSGVAEIRDLLKEAMFHRGVDKNKKTILFIDEIHRFNKAQQDALMPDVEEGIIILIGATTHNPYFAINSTLLSRSLMFTLNALSGEDIQSILKRALIDKKKGLGKILVRFDEKALNYLVTASDGDARIALNALEMGVLAVSPGANGYIHFTLKSAEESMQRKAFVYDKDGDKHYDVASAFIKSMRGSDPDAAIYWMAVMLNGGEDPRFIARRIVICAAEDVGNADPQALVVAAAALEASEFVGMPEAQIILSQAVTYIATAPKSNASYMAINKAMKDVKERRTIPVPPHLRGTGYPGSKALGYGKGYKYPHDYDRGFVKQAYLPEKTREYYEPKKIGFEKIIKERLKDLKDEQEK